MSTYNENNYLDCTVYLDGRIETDDELLESFFKKIEAEIQEMEKSKYDNQEVEDSIIELRSFLTMIDDEDYEDDDE